MEPAYLTGIAVFGGSIVGGIASLSSTLIAKKHEDRARRALDDKGGRQKLYTQFIEEASKLYLDALVHDQPEPSAMVSVYALISKMRVVSRPNVVETAEAVIQTIFGTYALPNKTVTELHQLMLNREFLDPLLTFSEVCRGDLHEWSLGAKRGDRSGTPIAEVLGPATQAAAA
jgi:hypothetical protein